LEVHYQEKDMKKRGSDDFPFDDLAGPRKSPWNDSGEQPEVKYDNNPAPKPESYRPAGSIPVQPSVPQRSVPGVSRNEQQRPQKMQNPTYQQQTQPVRTPAYQQKTQPVRTPDYQQSPARNDGNIYEQEFRDNARVNQGTSVQEYELRTPRPRTLNRQIQILTFISAILLVIVLLLGYFAFFTGKKASPASSSSSATAIVTAATLAGSQGVVVSVTPAGSEAAATPANAADISVTPVSTVSNDPNSLANLPPSKEHPVIALTFDDGPSNTLTPKLLEILEGKGVHVTFFMLGQMVLDADPAILKRMAADGDELGNHTYDHSSLKKLTADQIRSELTKTNDAIFAAAGVYPTVMRPPSGESSDTVLAVSKEMNLPVVNWSYESCPQDWLKANQDPAFISQYVIDNAANGHIVLLHDIHATTVDSIAAMIDGLTAKGYRFATVSELLAAQPKGEETGVLYCYGTF